MGVFMVGNLAASFSNNISEVIIFRGQSNVIGTLSELSTHRISPVVRIRWRGWRRDPLASADCNVRRCQPSGQVRSPF